MSDQDSIHFGEDGDLLLDDPSEMASTSTRLPTVTENAALDTILAAIQDLSQRLGNVEKRQNDNFPQNPKKRKMTDPQSQTKRVSPQPGPSTAREEGEVSTVMEKSDIDDSSAVNSLERALVGDSDEEEKEGKDDDAIFSEIASAFAVTEEKGPPVNAQLAALLQERFGDKLPDKQLREKLQAYPIPENCPNMGVPRTNQEVFNALQPNARKIDLRLSNTQQSISKAAVAMTRCADRILEMRKQLKQTGSPPPTLLASLTACIEHLANGLSLTGHAAKDLSHKRRDLHRSKLPVEAAGICAPHIPMTPEWLYPHGSDFYKSLNEARANRKLSQEMRGQTRREHGYQSQGQRPHPSSNRNSFLGQRPWKQGSRGRRNWHQNKRGGNMNANQQLN